ncbi:hypothetical protein [Photobacterium nomapromontoriensis]|uniref:hypothetical protein n=1 Tax=Photobacterium nomapromontoriensis TaxID=2910237 RepID=UPI003D13182C
MTNQLKRVNCSLFLDPVNSEADRYAVSIMQRWVEERRLLVETPSAGKELHHNLHRHKDIYLSGLFLHLLSPALTSQLSGVLSEQNVHMETLAQKLKMCGLVLPEQAAIATTESPTGLSDELARFQQSLSTQLDSLHHAVAKPADDNGSVAESVQTELADFKTALKAELVTQLASEMKAHSQAAEIAELKALISAQSQMIRALQHSGVTATSSADSVAEQEAGPNLSEQIASIRKVKKKGLF